MPAARLSFVPFSRLDGVPNVVVDGAAGPETRLVLSHWPGSATPDVVREDLSAQIALAALDHPELFDGLAAVSNNHFDQDGLMSVYALVDPEGALARPRPGHRRRAGRRLRVVRGSRLQRGSRWRSPS